MSIWARPRMRAFIAELKQRGTIVDPTLVIFEGDCWPRAARLAGLHTLYGDHLARARPDFKAGGYPLVEGYTRDDYRKSYAKMVELVRGAAQSGRADRRRNRRLGDRAGA